MDLERWRKYWSAEEWARWLRDGEGWIEDLRATREATHADRPLGSADFVRGLALGPFRLARLIAIGDDILVQKADGDQISREVLQGTNPTLLRVAGWRGELLELYFHRLPRSIRADGSNPIIVTVYATASSLPATEEAKAVVRKIQKDTKEDVVYLNIRTDTWFIEDTAFPLWYPFAHWHEPPTFATYAAQTETYCEGEGIR